MDWLRFIVFIIGLFNTLNASAVMSIDLGAEWLEVAIVSPSKPIEIALNKESKRRTPVILGFDTKNNERLFGEDAEAVWKRSPQNCLKYFPLLLGKEFGHPIVKTFQAMFPFYKLAEDPVRRTILVHISDQFVFSVEELVAQFFTYARRIAESSAGHKITNAVIIVPGYYNQAERFSVIEAAKLANLNVLQLFNDHSAIALNFAVFNSNSIKSNASHNMYLDFGATKTIISIAEYELVSTKSESYPKVTIKGVGYSLEKTTGLHNQIALQRYLAKKFNELRKTKNNVFENHRAMAKLFSEAGRLKKILSVNVETVSKVENLMDGIDFQLKIKRQDFEELLGDRICDEIRHTVDQAFKMSGLKSLNEIEQFSVFGGNSRVPKIEECLQAILPVTISKNLDREEAAAIGAAFKAADLSVGFRVKKVAFKDVILFPISIEIDKVTNTFKKTLYGLANKVPQRKVITFNRHQNFEFKIIYDNLEHLDDLQKQYLGSSFLQSISLSNVSDFVPSDNYNLKGVKTQFDFDESSIISLFNVEYAYEKPITESKGIFEKISDYINSNQTNAENETLNDDVPESLDKEKANGTTTSGNQSMIAESIPIQHDQKFLSLILMSDEQREQAFERLSHLDRKDDEKKFRDLAQNNLESFLLDTKMNFEVDSFVECADQKTVEKTRNEMKALSDWLDENSYDESQTADVFDKKLKDFKSLIRPISQRYAEHQNRPEILKKLEARLENATIFLNYLKEFRKTTEDDIYTEKEVESFEKFLKETKDWKQSMESRQNLLAKSDPVELTVESIEVKLRRIESEVVFLSEKPKWMKPKVKPTAAPAAADTDSDQHRKNQSDANTNHTDADADADASEPKTSGTQHKNHTEL